MTRADLQADYRSRSDSLSAAIASLRRRGRMLVWGEVAAFCAAVGCVAAYTIYGSASFLAAAAALTGCYVAARRADVAGEERLGSLTALKQVYDNELLYLDGDFSAFDDGRRYADPQHAFTFDMDIFGPQSLFHRINRTVTLGGADTLAGCLRMEAFGTDDAAREAIGRRAAAISRLAAMEEQRAAFIAMNRFGRIDTPAVLSALGAVRRLAVPRFFASPASLVVAGLSLGVFAVLILLSVFTPMPSGVPVLWGMLQFFGVLMLCAAPLRRMSSAVNAVHRQMRAYAELVRLMVSSGMLSAGDPALDGVASCSAAAALRPFDELRRILDGLDRRGNILGLILFDTFLLSDFFLVRRFLRWQCTYAAGMERWTGVVSTVDALVSMATFCHNEPSAGRADIVVSPGVVYEAEGLCHPFLGEKAVANDFRLDDSHYYIVTGANMAGKSTFLRSLGVNYILAMNGMPVFASRLRVSLFSLFSSMRTSDDLSHGISYFNAELLRLRQLIDHCRSHRRTLIILDEILKGTNSLDKLNGSRMFLEAISRLPVTGVIATHDLELSRLADEHPARFANWCFEIRLADEITYTYKITPGVARNQNATHLLRRIIEGV